MTPYAREEQKGDKHCMATQTMTSCQGKPQSFQNGFENTLTLTDDLFST